MNKKPQDELLRTWREGMNALAQLPQTFAKISQLGFIQDNWEKKGSLEESRVKSLVKVHLLYSFFIKKKRIDPAMTAKATYRK